MSVQPPPTITSFVIRFVVDQFSQNDESSPYRGAIRHIQSEEEILFNTWSDAVAFIQRYVPIESSKVELDAGPDME